jgi:hypothetical protein
MQELDVSSFLVYFGNESNETSLKDALRSQVESELAVARIKIKALTKSINMRVLRPLLIESIMFGNALCSESMKDSRKKPNRTPSGDHQRSMVQGASASLVGRVDDKGMWSCFSYSHPTCVFHSDKFLNLRSDDFRSALFHASNSIKTLSLLARPAAHSPGLTSASSASGHSPATTNPTDVDRTRIDTMAKLITILQRNMRVRYELNIEDLAQAQVFHQCSIAMLIFLTMLASSLRSQTTLQSNVGRLYIAFCDTLSLMQKL